MISTRNTKWEQITTAVRDASTVYGPGYWLADDGSGHVVPLFPTGYVRGLCLESITSANSDYGVTGYIHIDIPTTADEFLMPVTTGTATDAMVGSLYDIDDANPTGLDVSGSGDQFLIIRFISTSLVVVKVSRTA